MGKGVENYYPRPRCRCWAWLLDWNRARGAVKNELATIRQRSGCLILVYTQCSKSNIYS